MSDRYVGKRRAPSRWAWRYHERAMWEALSPTWSAFDAWIFGLLGLIVLVLTVVPYFI